VPITAYSTQALLGGSMTDDRTAIDGPVLARSENATEISPKGLLPQLIDVLNALAEGQQLLSRKIRIAKLDYARDSALVFDGSPEADPSDVAALRSFVGTNPAASNGAHRESATDIGDLGARQTSVNGNGSSPERSVGVSERPVNVEVPKTASLSTPPATVVTHADTRAANSGETSARTDRLDSAPSDDTTAEPLNRDYNFFDELDARLADLQEPTNQSDDL